MCLNNSVRIFNHSVKSLLAKPATYARHELGIPRPPLPSLPISLPLPQLSCSLIALRERERPGFGRYFVTLTPGGRSERRRRRRRRRRRPVSTHPSVVSSSSGDRTRSDLPNPWSSARRWGLDTHQSLRRKRETGCWTPSRPPARRVVRPSVGAFYFAISPY